MHRMSQNVARCSVIDALAVIATCRPGEVLVELELAPNLRITGDHHKDHNNPHLGEEAGKTARSREIEEMLMAVHCAMRASRARGSHRAMRAPVALGSGRNLAVVDWRTLFPRKEAPQLLPPRNRNSTIVIEEGIALGVLGGNYLTPRLL